MIVGNVVEDLLPNGSRTPGGPSLYSAWVAAGLEVDVTLVSRVPATYDKQAFSGFDVIALDADDCPLFDNHYDAAGHRTQVLRGFGESIPPEETARVEGDALLVAPAYHELDRVPDGKFPVRVVALQGPLRSVDAENRVRPTETAFETAMAFVVPNGIVVFSEEDATAPLDLAEAMSAGGATVVLTLGPAGVQLFRPRTEPVIIPGYPSHTVDPTGAGDAFAAAFTIRLTETGDLIEACRYANAAGALVVEGSGREAIPTRPRVEDRMAQGAA